MNKINWEIIDNQMINLKYPLCFLNNLFKINENFTDNQLILILRFFFKYNYRCFLEYNLKILIVLLNKDKILSKNIILEIYDLIEKKILLSKIIKKWKLSYNKDNFWDKKINEQIDYLNNLKMRFYSNFDVCKSNSFFFNKIYTLMKYNNNINFHIKELLNRLTNVYDLLGETFFKNYNILCIKKSKFIQSTPETKIKYSKYIFQKINKILCKIFDSFILFNYIKIKIDNILNPLPIDFKIENFDSETDIDDLLFMIEN